MELFASGPEYGPLGRQRTLPLNRSRNPYVKPQKEKRKMKAAFRNAYGTLSRFSASTALNPETIQRYVPLSLTTSPKTLAIAASLFPFRSNCLACSAGAFQFLTASASSSSTSPSMTNHNLPCGDAMEAQFESFRTQLEESGNIRERIQAVAMEIESATRIMHANLLLVHQSRPLAGTLIDLAIILISTICLV